MKVKQLINYAVQSILLKETAFQFIFKHKNNELLLYKSIDWWSICEHGKYGYTIYLNDKYVKHIPFLENI